MMTHPDHGARAAYEARMAETIAKAQTPPVTATPVRRRDSRPRPRSEVESEVA